MAVSRVVTALAVLAFASCLYAQDTGAASEQIKSAPTEPRPTIPELREGALSQEQMRNLMRIVAEKDLENEKRSRDYTYIQREEEHKLVAMGE
jgi:hypothetical protein